MLPFSFYGNCVGVVGTQHGGTVDIRRNLLRTLDSIHGGEGRPRVLSKTARSLWMMAARDIVSRLKNKSLSLLPQAKLR